ncbi:hypothetical protein [Bradyrhizobium manausense]|uniref:Uncharacterized protein n=1 Tax=Bradyrhizobium manausense TaxID=989370 RepID=A0A0R3E1D2_9BRAD|nr:hypothetical protein [Bradyrhizobium manausense]KRQ14238.1 hypothetical protein AOQ71_13240 [Bradyrhizobium manausense]
MRTYSHFFQTLHDEIGPVGHLGRGTHYSVLRAVSFQDADGGLISEAQFLDFAIIWDEDHDERVIEPIYKLYCSGLLSNFVMFGERKGSMTGIISPFSVASTAYLSKRLQDVCNDMANGDFWTTEIGSFANPSGIISDNDANVALYLANINMLWHLGLKKIDHPISQAAQEAQRTQWMERIMKQSKAG